MLHPTISTVAPPFSLSLSHSLRLSPSPSLFLASSFALLRFLSALFAPSLKRPSPRGAQAAEGGGRVVGRRRNKNAGNRRGTSCRAHHFTACAGLRSCVQQDFVRISFLCFLPIPSSRSPPAPRLLRIVAYFFIRCPFIVPE